MIKRSTKRNPAALSPIRRAAIYLRVSSERQAVKKGKVKGEGDYELQTSPRAQEQACRDYCERKGYLLVEVYRDVEKYRASGRMVEPSGTRADRPQFRRMLADADNGRFDMVIAWREDRLYRAFRPMLDFIECIERNSIAVELTNDSFDPRFAEVKAWAAKMELDAKHERMLMGVAGRLESGRAWNNYPPYGWRRVDGRLETEPAESAWVVRIWEWFATGVTAREIRRRLMAGGAPERRAGNKTPWSTSYIYQLLHRDTYHTGRLVTTWGDEQFTLEAPPIISPELAARVSAVMGRKQRYPARNLRHDYLAGGLLYCKECDVRMSSRTLARKDRKSGMFSEYACFRNNMGAHGPGCAKRVSVEKADATVWEKFWAKISDPVEFEREVTKHIAEVRAREANAEADVARLMAKLDEIISGEQWVIAQNRTGRLTDAQADLQLAGLGFERAAYEHDLAEARLLVGNTAVRLLEAAHLYREQVADGAVAINATPQTQEQARLQFAARRKLIENLVTRIDLEPGYKVTIHTVWDLRDVLPVGVQNSVTAACWR